MMRKTFLKNTTSNGFTPRVIGLLLAVATAIILLAACAVPPEPAATLPPAETLELEPPAVDATEAPQAEETVLPDVAGTVEGRPVPDLPEGAERIPTTAEPAAVVGEVPDDLLQQIIADLVDRTGVEPQAIEILRAESTVWNDGSLGCPQPGQFYTQAQVDGYWVVLQAGEQEYDYRVGQGGYFFLCEPQVP